ncbi:hypothetical protein [Pseudoalteromonas luteoviolacea]|uniref:hypothetical protein n=1 Tax=Pseudoalteromonas luteoviolacea TaxID=43657 RepID=UPI00114FC995|nr:hypothetical protein [Pseudoalteromonas luteoviolacea]TQF71139.1 hypothetical protein FLM44_08635 [Pseudoalteromonas luteoviolacea]
MSNKYLTDIVSKPNMAEYKESIISEINTSKRPFVHYPPSARGDMNAYKYVAFKEGVERPVTAFEYFDSPREGSEQEEFNKNIPAINQHIKDLGLLEEGRDYVWLTTKDINDVKKCVDKTHHYQEYDNNTYDRDIRRKAMEFYKDKIKKDPYVIEYLKAKTIEEVKKREKCLTILNINRRAKSEVWEPRNERHGTYMEAFKGIMDIIRSINKAKKLKMHDICFVGGKLTPEEVTYWQKFCREAKTNFFDLTDAMDKPNSLNRTQQRCVHVALAENYKSTIYFGHQSGVNEDANILPRTNVFSLSEYLHLGQIGISRVEARSQLDPEYQNEVGLGGAYSVFGNFYSLRNCEFLTSEGVLAAIQLKLDMFKNNHISLDEAWDDILGRYAWESEVPYIPKKELDKSEPYILFCGKYYYKRSIEIPHDYAVKKLLNRIFASAEVDERNFWDNIKDEEAKRAYIEAADLLVRRKLKNQKGFTTQTIIWLTKIIEQLFERHDRPATETVRHESPLTVHKRRLEAQNAGRVVYTLGGNQIKHRAIKDTSWSDFWNLVDNQPE